VDIDIDFPNRDEILSKLKHRSAKLESDKKHATGVYVTEIPYNPIDNRATIDYKTADSRGYFKIDFLNVSIYEDVKSEQHLTQLMNKEPMWELLEHAEFADQVFHLNGQHSILMATKPRNVFQLAAVLAMIRPAKRHLIGKDWDSIMKEVWVKPNSDEYYFKKAHSFSYAMAVVVHMNLLCEQLSSP